MSVEVKWENFMIAHKNRELQKTVSVDNLLSLSLSLSRLPARGLWYSSSSPIVTSYYLLVVSARTESACSNWCTTRASCYNMEILH